MKLIIAIAVLLCSVGSLAQNQKAASQLSLFEQVVALDKAVFDAFNNCDIAKFKNLFTPDVEFYHDKGGVTLTAEKLAESVQMNICGNPMAKVRREAVPETLKVYPMDGYGAIITGEHNFYQVIAGTEKLTGTAKFTHLCIFKDGRWRISRVLSYDHREIK